jgi:hypothetical protein
MKTLLIIFSLYFLNAHAEESKAVVRSVLCESYLPQLSSKSHNFVLNGSRCKIDFTGPVGVFEILNENTGESVPLEDNSFIIPATGRFDKLRLFVLYNGIKQINLAKEKVWGGINSSTLKLETAPKVINNSNIFRYNPDYSLAKHMYHISASDSETGFSQLVEFDLPFDFWGTNKYHHLNIRKYDSQNPERDVYIENIIELKELGNARKSHLYLEAGFKYNGYNYLILASYPGRDNSIQTLNIISIDNNGKRNKSFGRNGFFQILKHRIGNTSTRFITTLSPRNDNLESLIFAVKGNHNIYAIDIDEDLKLKKIFDSSILKSEARRSSYCKKDSRPYLRMIGGNKLNWHIGMKSDNTGIFKITERLYTDLNVDSRYYMGMWFYFNYTKGSKTVELINCNSRTVRRHGR